MDASHHSDVAKAFRRDDAPAVRAFLEAHPEVAKNIDDPIGPFNSPPITNVRSRAMLDVLLDFGANIDAKSDWWAGGFGLLHVCDPELAAYAIERGATVDAHAAARLGMMDRLRELVEANPDVVHERGGDGQFPLHFASTVEIAAYLLDHGAEIDGRDLDHVSTAAMWMISERQEIVRFLVLKGCQTEILMAAALGDISLVGSILDKDPEAIRMRVSDEFFPLIGSENGGTIYQWQLGWYVSAHQVARKFEHDQVFDLLWERSPDDVRLVTACWFEDSATADSLMAKSPVFGPVEKRQLAHAAREDNLEAVRLMLKAGLPVDSKSQHGATALHWAAWHGRIEMIEMLLAAGADVENRENDYEGSPIGWACHASEHGWGSEFADYPGAVRVLLAAGATPPKEPTGTPAVQAALGG